MTQVGLNSSPSWMEVNITKKSTTTCDVQYTEVNSSLGIVSSLTANALSANSLSCMRYRYKLLHEPMLPFYSRPYSFQSVSTG